jgi:hypothetical protein
MSYYTPHDVKTQAKQSFSIVPMQLFFDKRLASNRTAQLAYVALAFFADAKTGLVGYANDDGEFIAPSNVKMSKILGITPSNFSAGLRLLKECGWVVVVEKRVKNTWIYRLEFPTEFKTDVGMRGYPAELNGMLSDDEYARIQASRAKADSKPAAIEKASKFKKPLDGSKNSDDLTDISADDFNAAMAVDSSVSSDELIKDLRTKNQVTRTRVVSLKDAVTDVARYLATSVKLYAESDIAHHALSYSITEPELREKYPDFDDEIDNFLYD